MQFTVIDEIRGETYRCAEIERYPRGSRPTYMKFVTLNKPEQFIELASVWADSYIGHDDNEQGESICKFTLEGKTRGHCRYNSSKKLITVSPNFHE